MNQLYERLKRITNTRHKLKPVTVFIGILGFYVLVIALSPYLAKPFPLLSTTLSWIWFLLPGLLLSMVLVKQVSWCERVPISFVLTIGLATPVTILAILLHSDLDTYLLYHAFLLISTAISWVIFTMRHPQPSNESSVLDIRSSVMEMKRKLSPFLPVILLLGLALVILSNQWPLFGDEIAGLSIFSEVIQQDQITGTEPFHGSGVPVTPRNELTTWVYMAILTNKISGISPPDFFVNTRTILVVIAMLSIATFFFQTYKNKQQAIFTLCLWSIYLLTTIHSEGTGNNLVTRIIQDKFLGWFVVVPIVMVFIIWFVDNRSWSKLICLSLAMAGGSLVHPITLTQAMILFGGFGLLFLIFNRSRKVFINFATVLIVILLSTLIPFIQYIRFNNYSPVDLAGLSNAIEFGRLSAAVNKYRLWMLGEGRFILHPSVILDPVILMAYLFLPVLILQKKKEYASYISIGVLFILPILLYTPFFAALAGKVVTPYLIWRLAWPLPLFSVMTLSAIIWLLLTKLIGYIKNKFAQWNVDTLIYIGALILIFSFSLPSILSGLENYKQRRAEINLSTCGTAKNTLLFLDRISNNEPVNVLAAHNLNYCIPAYVALANVIEYRGYGTVNRLSDENIANSIQRVEDVNYFNATKFYDDRVINTLKRYEVDYILIEKNNIDLNFQFKHLPSDFYCVYEDPLYNLYKVSDTVTETGITKAFTLLQKNQFSQALIQFNQIISNDPENMLALWGLGITYEGLGKVNEAILTYQKAILLTPNESALHAKLGKAYLLVGDFELAIKEFKSSVSLSPNIYSNHNHLGQAYLLANQQKEAKASFEKAASLQAVENTATYFSILGNTYLSNKFFLEAIEYYENAISIEVSSKGYVDLARSHYSSGQVEKAESIYKKAADYDRWDYLPHLELGYLYKDQGNLILARNELEIACKLNPTNTSAYILLGQVIKQQSGVEEAINRLNELKNMGRVIPGPYRSLVNLMVAEKDYQRALEELNFSSTIQPNNPTILTAKGFIFLAEDQIENAYEAFKEALLLNSNLIPARIGLSMIFSSEARYDLETGQFIQIKSLNPLSIWAHLYLAQTYQFQGQFDLANKEFDQANQLDPENPIVYASRGNLYKAIENYSAAESDYLKALEFDPKNLQSLLGLGDLYFLQGNYSSSEEEYRKAKMENPDSIYPEIKLADLYWQLGRFTEAESLVKQALDKAPNSDLGLVKLAEIYESQGKIAEAKSIYQQIIETDPGYFSAYLAIAQMMAEESADSALIISMYNDLVNVNPEAAQAYLMTGQFFMEQGQYELAEQIFQKALNFYDATLENYIALSDLHQRTGNRVAALEILQMSTKQFPFIGKAYNNLAEFYLKIGDIGTAQINFEKATKLDPGLVSAYIGMSLIEQIKGNTSRAEQIVESEYAKKPTSSELLLAIANLKEINGRPDLAEEYYEKAITIAPSSIDSYQTLGEFHLRHGNYPEALLALQDALALPGSKVKTLLDIGDVYQMTMEKDKALSYYREASILDKSDTRPYFSLARLYQSDSEWDKAQEVLNKAISMKPGDSNAHFEMGRLFQKFGHLENAQNYFTLAYSFDQSNTNSLISLADISVINGNFEQGITYLDQVVQGFPDQLQAYSALSQIYQISGNQAQAEMSLSQATKKVTNKQEAYLLRGAFYEKQGNWEQAEADYRKAWVISELSKDIGYRLISFHLKRFEMDSAFDVLNQLSQQWGMDADLYIEYGEIYSFQADWPRAIQSYQKAIELDVKAQEGYLGLSNVYKSLGKIDYAITLHQTALENVPNDPETLISLGETLYSQGKYQEADRLFQNALNVDPLNKKGLLYLERLSRIGQEIDFDLSYFIKSALKNPSSESYITLAQLYLSRGDVNLAHSWFQRAIIFSPYKSINWVHLGNYYFFQSQPNKAFDAYEKAMQYEPAFIPALLAMGTAQEDIGAIDQAEYSYQQIIENCPVCIEGYIALAKLYYHQGEFENSLEVIHTGIDTSPGDYRGYAILGDILSSLDPENIKNASDAYLDGLEVLPGSSELYSRLGQLHTKKFLSSTKKLEATQALELLAAYKNNLEIDQIIASTYQLERVLNYSIDNAIKKYPAYQAKLFMNESTLRNETDSEFTSALSYYRIALSLEPNNESAFIGLGKLYLAVGSYEEAARYFELALKYNPNGTISASYLGNIYFELGRFDDALAVFSQVLVFQPDNIIALLGLSQIYDSYPSLTVQQAADAAEKKLMKIPSLVDHLRAAEVKLQDRKQGK